MTEARVPRQPRARSSAAEDDAALAADVAGRLREAGAGWQVSASDGVVRVTGPATAFDEELAVAIARPVPGVRAVEIAPRPAPAP